MTATDALFRLAVELVTSHRRAAPGKVTVIPVVVDDLREARHVLQALCELTNGRLLDAGDDDLQHPVPVTTDVVRHKAVEVALTPAGGHRRVLLRVTGETVDAEFADPPTGPDASLGERTVLAVARAASHAALDSHELAVIEWQDAAVDLRFRSALWSLAVDQLPGLRHQTLRTLIIVVETVIDVALHCQTDRGFRFAIDQGRLLRRHGRDDLNSTAHEIAQHPRPFVVFLGAGFGASSRLPLGNELRDPAIRRLLGIDLTYPIPADDLARRFHTWIVDQPGWLTPEEEAMTEGDYVRQLTLEQVIRAEKRVYPELPTLKEFRAHHDEVIETPGSAAIDLGRILETAAGRIVIVEVNFDRLVETQSRVALNVFASDEDYRGAAEYVKRYLDQQETAVPVLKLHGTIDQLETCVISDEQTRLGVGQHKLEALRTLLHEPPRLWVYVGASMRDRDLARVFDDEAWARGVDERWVSPYLADTVEEFGVKRTAFWDNSARRSIDNRITTETADAFFAALKSSLQNLLD